MSCDECRRLKDELRQINAAIPDRLKEATEGHMLSAVLMMAEECRPFGVSNDPNVELCPNCDSALPEGCCGLFKGQGRACWLNRPVLTVSEGKS